MAVVLISSLMLLSWSKHVFPQLFSQFKYILVNQKFTLSFYQTKMLSHPYFLSMAIISWLNISLFCYLIIPQINPTIKDHFEVTFTYVTFYCGAFLIIKTLLQLILGEIFDNPLIKRFLFSKSSLLSFNSWILYSGSILLIYLLNQNLIIIYSVSLLFLLLYIIGYINILRNYKKYVLSQILYFILYLCALEIAPLVIIISYLKIA